MATLPTEIMLLGWSVPLLLVHIGIQGQAATRDQGVAWNAGPRDGTPPPLGRFADRAARAVRNFRETFPVFIALALALAVTERVGGIGTAGAWLWFAARVVYLPLYLFGVPYVRSLVWLISVAGLLLMLARLLLG